MIDRLLQKDIERRSSVPREITSGTPKNPVTAVYTEVTNGGTGIGSVAITNNFVSFYYDAQTSTTWSRDYAIPLNLKANPLVMAWVVGVYEIVSVKPTVTQLDQNSTIITGTGVNLPYYTGYTAVATATWDKNTLHIGGSGTGPGLGGGAVQTVFVYIKYAVYYDDSGVSEFGL